MGSRADGLVLLGLIAEGMPAIDVVPRVVSIGPLQIGAPSSGRSRGSARPFRRADPAGRAGQWVALKHRAIRRAADRGRPGSIAARVAQPGRDPHERGEIVAVHSGDGDLPWGKRFSVHR
jgi:hypothetical protein